MLAGIFATVQLATQKANASDFIERTTAVVHEDGMTTYMKPCATAVADRSPRAMRASVVATSSAQADAGVNASLPSCKPADCKKVSCDPADCKKVTCDPADCPPQCRPLCVKPTSVAKKQSVKEVGCKPAPAVAKASVVEGS